MKKIVSIVAIVLMTASLTSAQDSTKIKVEETQPFRGGFGIFPLPNKTMIAYRSNISKKWAFDSKYGYTFTAVPQFNLEFNILKRHIRNDIFNFYNGFGITMDGFTPGAIVPIGFEIKPFEKYRNIVFIAEASPKFTFSFSSGIYSTLSGNIGIIYFRPSKKKIK